MLIVLEDHIVASRFDALTGLCHYVVEHQGKRYTVSIAQVELDRHPPATHPTAEGTRQRRAVLTRAIEERLKGSPDPIDEVG